MGSDPTGFYGLLATGFLGAVLLLAMWYGLQSAWREVRRMILTRSLRTPKPVQEWLREYLRH